MRLRFGVTSTASVNIYRQADNEIIHRLHLNHNQIFPGKNVAVRAVTVNFAVDWVLLAFLLLQLREPLFFLGIISVKNMSMRHKDNN